MMLNTLTSIYVNEYKCSIKYWMDKSTVREELKIDSEMDDDNKTFDELSGIVDGNTMNSKYCNFISKARLHNINAEIAESLIHHSMKSFKHSSQYFQWKIQIPAYDEQAATEDEIDPRVKVDVIYEVNFGKSCAKQVAEKYNLNLLSVANILKEFKLMLKNSTISKWKLGRPNKLSEEMKRWLKDKIKTSYLGKHFTLRTLKRIVLQKFPGLANISTTTLSRVMRHDFGLSYKKATAWMKVLTPEMKSWFLKWAASVAFLLDNIKSLTFIDEFKISPVKKDHYTWSLKGKPAWKFGYNSTFNISAIVAFNADGGVYFLATNQTIDSEIFQFFLSKLIDNEDKHLYINERVWTLSENASIHKTIDVKNILKQRNASLITITAYSQWLNPTEN